MQLTGRVTPQTYETTTFRSGPVWIDAVDLHTGAGSITEFSLYDVGDKNLGNNLVSDSNFLKASGSWTNAGVGWTLGGGAAVKAAGSIDAISQDTGEASGEIHKLTITLSVVSAGTLVVSCAAITLATIAATGTYTYLYRATGADNLTITPSIDFDGTVTECSRWTLGNLTDRRYNTSFVVQNDSRLNLPSSIPFQWGIFAILVGANSTADVYEW